MKNILKLKSYVWKSSKTAIFTEVLAYSFSPLDFKQNPPYIQVDKRFRLKFSRDKQYDKNQAKVYLLAEFQTEIFGFRINFDV